jgi:hypothetical protein
VTPQDVVGVWRLASYVQIGPDGAVLEGPLGAAPDGLLIYTGDGHVAVGMMPTGGGPAAETYMGYSGRWRLSGDRMTHEVLVSAHPAMAGSRQVRTAELAGGVLTLRGSAVLPADGVAAERVLTWRRVESTTDREPKEGL